MIRAVNLYSVRMGAATHRIWATGACDAIAQALALYGQHASSARKVQP